MEGCLAFPINLAMIPNSHSLLSLDKRVPLDSWTYLVYKKTLLEINLLRLIHLEIILKEFKLFKCGCCRASVAVYETQLRLSRRTTNRSSARDVEALVSQIHEQTIIPTLRVRDRVVVRCRDRQARCSTRSAWRMVISILTRGLCVPETCDVKITVVMILKEIGGVCCLRNSS